MRSQNKKRQGVSEAKATGKQDRSCVGVGVRVCALSSMHKDKMCRDYLK